MSITLNATLQTAQDGQSHHPIIEIMSKPMVNDIPFVGQLLTGETQDEQRPNSLTHSSNRVLLVYKFHDDYFKFVYTDEERQTFNFVTLDWSDLGMGVNDDTIEATLCELADGNVGMIFTCEDASNIYLRWAKLSPVGVVSDNGLIGIYAKTDVYNVASPYVIKLADDSYFLVYLKGQQILPTSSGTYTGTTNGEYEVMITQDGDETTAKFKWRKDGGAWSGEITCTGGAQLLAEGVYITFVPGQYMEGMLFKITVTAAQKARGYISIYDTPLDGDQVVIGVNTYTYKTPPLVGGGNPNDVAIDVFAYEISLENLRCAITDTDYEGTGEGVRYGNGTVAHPDVTATRWGATMIVEALVAGAAGNNISITVPAMRFGKYAMTGGADSEIGEVRASVSSVIFKRTSADFEAWSAELEIRPGGVGAEQKDHISALQLDNGDIWITFDNYDDWLWSNIYYSVSTDNGISWSNATAVTDYDSPSAKGLHPMIVQKSATQVYLVYHEEMGALHMDSTDVGWPGGHSSITGLHVYNGKLYAVATDNIGNKELICAIEINIATWRIERSWNTTSVPAFHTVFGQEQVRAMKNRSNGKYIVVATKENAAIGVLNTETNTIKHYFFYDWGAYAIVKNVNWESPQESYPERNLAATYVDELNDRLYIVLKYQFAFKNILDIVWIDLTRELVPGSVYPVNSVYNSEDEWTESELIGLDDGDFKVYPNAGLALLSSFHPAVGVWTGRLMVFFVNDGGWSISRDYQGGVGEDLPFYGIRKCIYYGGSVYGTFRYYATEGMRKGLCRIELASEHFSYIEPIWPVRYDEYGLLDLCLTDDNMMAITSYLYGITIYDPASGAWTLYDNDTVPGLTPDGNDTFAPIVHDSTSGLLFGGVYRDPFLSWYGVVGFNRYGTLKQPLYKIGELTDVWNFGSENDFVVGFLDFDVTINLDPEDNGIYAFWVKHSAQMDEMSIKWAKETAQFDLTPYLLKDTPIAIKRGIETNQPNALTFGISHGHLFDPFNEISLWRNYVAKGHKLVVRCGETVADVDYWQDCGSYLIVERSMITYERGKYPTMDIKAEDKRITWDEQEIFVSTDYTNTPEYILGDVLENEAGEDITDIDIPVFDNSTTLYHQWVDTTVLKIIEQICDRYGYFPKVTVTDKFTCGKISDQNSVNHTYTNQDQILTYTPDDTFSDYTNRIVVTCEGRDFEERVFPQERVLFLTGTIGWWGQKKDRQEYYSENREKQVRNPELRRIETAENIMFELMGKVREYISYEDPNDKYVTVTIEAPDLRPALAAAIAAYLAASKLGGIVGNGGKTAALILIINILASITNYQFEIWGDPVGYVRRSWQAIAEDTDLQALANKVIEKKIEEPLAYYIDQAQAVADHEMLVLKLQRKRIKISKTAHLQDEEGDTLQLKHPYSNMNIKVFVTNLTRTMKLSKGPNDGYWTDEIEGWIL